MIDITNIDKAEDIAKVLWATDEFASSFAVMAGGDDPEPEAYLDLSVRFSEDRTYSLEVGDGDDAVCVVVTAAFVKELHQKLTLALIAGRHRPA